MSTRNWVIGLLEFAPDAMLIANPDGLIVLANPEMERLFGYAREDLIGQPIEILVPARFASSHPQKREGYFTHPKPRPMAAGLSLRGRRKDGSEFPAEISLSPLETEDGVFVTAAIRDITDRVRVREQEVLLKEIHHRVKNNLQVVSSLLKLHADRVSDPAARVAFLDAEARVRSIGLLHEKLYSTRDASQINLASYARSLVDALVRTFAAVVEVSIEMADVMVPVDLALPCGLILNELITNSFKHAFGPGSRAPHRIRVAARRDAGHLEISVADNGTGLPAGAPAIRPEALGMHLVRTLTRQVDGVLDVGPGPDGGAQSLLRFPLEGEA